ncbi:hypothetical protein [Lolliginicoccus levis]|uniref:hypothetical protein n=1 Tax=Lolliginicoccus levis TaxID=2919542 RepID=UPI00241E9F81|nr:hypothetical protein [Lolliginicoccus levis]
MTLIEHDPEAFPGLEPGTGAATDGHGPDASTGAVLRARRRWFRRAAAGRPAPPAHRLGVDLDSPVPPSRGDGMPAGGRIANPMGGDQWQGTTAQLCGLFPFAAPSGAHLRGVPVGINAHTGEPVGLDPAQLLVDGLVSNTGLWIQGQPGIGKSTFVKRLLLGLAGFGFNVQILGDLKDEYEDIIRALDGQIIHLGRGRGTLNPLDTAPLRGAINASVGARRQQLIDDAAESRLALLEALLAIESRTDNLRASERVLLARAVEIASRVAEAENRDPIIPEVLAVIDAGGAECMQAVAATSGADYEQKVLELVSSLRLMCEGAIKGIFDRPSSFRIDDDTRAVSVSLASVEDASDNVVAAAMMCSWAWSSAMTAGQVAAGKRRNVFQVQDELWRALRAAPGLVEKSDRVTRLGRHRGVISAQVTHSLEDLEALPSESDRAKARGLAARNALKVIGGTDNREMDRLDEITPFTSYERAEVTSWSAPPTWVPGQQHPGRGRYLIKSGERIGIPVRMTLTDRERVLYNTDKAFSSLKRGGQ